MHRIRNRTACVLKEEPEVDDVAHSPAYLAECSGVVIRCAKEVVVQARLHSSSERLEDLCDYESQHERDGEGQRLWLNRKDPGSYLGENEEGKSCDYGGTDLGHATSDHQADVQKAIADNSMRDKRSHDQAKDRAIHVETGRAKYERKDEVRNGAANGGDSDPEQHELNL